jgi:hypothetical protein
MILNCIVWERQHLPHEFSFLTRDRTVMEIIVNVATSMPFVLVGLQTPRSVTLYTRIHGFKMIVLVKIITQMGPNFISLELVKNIACVGKKIFLQKEADFRLKNRDPIRVSWLKWFYFEVREKNLKISA